MEKPRYERLQCESEESGLLEEKLSTVTNQTAGWQTSAWSMCSLLWGSLLGLLLGALLSELVHRGESSSDYCTRHISAWSPALVIHHDDDSTLERFNGALRDSNWFRGPPSQEIDDAWAEIANPEGGLVRLSSDDVERIGAPEYASQYTPEMGGGYIGGIEVLHQLHCVNMLRQATYLDYYLKKNEEWQDRQTLRYHLDHCIDILRQKLMSDPDVGIVTYIWAKAWKNAFPDFNTIHKCRDYSKVLEWVHDNSVHGRNISDLVRAPGALERDSRP